MHICKFLLYTLIFFAQISTKLKKLHFFRLFKDYNLGREHENCTNDPIFSIYFFCSTCLYHSFLNLKIPKIYFQIHQFGPFWSVKYLNFSPKATIWTAHHTFLKGRHSEVTQNLYYVLSSCRSQITVFLGSSSWTILEVEENFMQILSAFLLIFW